MVAKQDPHQLRGSIGAADRDPFGAPGSGGVSFSSQQATLRRLNKAFGGFRRVKRGKKAGIHDSRARPGSSVEWPKDGDGARWLPEQKRVYLQGIGQSRLTCIARCRVG